MDGTVDFYRKWEMYRRGFGNPEKEIWLGMYLNIKVSGLCYDMHLHYKHNVLPLQKLSYIFNIGIEIIQGSQGFITF
jgi:hypothetical protein